MGSPVRVKLFERHTALASRHHPSRGPQFGISDFCVSSSNQSDSMTQVYSHLAFRYECNASWPLEARRCYTIGGLKVFQVPVISKWFLDVGLQKKRQHTGTTNTRQRAGCLCGEGGAIDISGC